MGLLDALRFRRAPPPPPIEVEGQKVLLVYLFSGLGDGLLLAPIVDALLRAGAKAPVGLLVRELPGRALKLLDLPVRIHTLPEVLVARPEPSDPESHGEAIKLGLALRKRGYQIGVDLTARADVDARLWLERAEIPVRLGYGYPGEPGLDHAARDERHEGLEHWTRYLLAPLAPLGLPELQDEVGLELNEAPTEKAEQLWGGEEARVLLLPGSSRPDNRFDPEAFVATGRHALAQGARVVVAGGPGELKLVRGMAAALDVMPYAAKGLAPLFALVGGADVVITNDTGPMHLAYLTHRRVIALYNQLGPACWGPLRPSDRFSTLKVPNMPPEGVRPIVERWMIDQLERHLSCVR